MTTVYDRFARTAERVPDEPLVWFEGETTTYAEAEAAVERRAALLDDVGVGPGDRVGVLLPNDPEFVYLLLATARVGATFVPLDHRQEGDVLAYLLDDADVSALVVDGAVHDSFRDVRAEASTGTVLLHDGPADAAGRDYDDAVTAAPDAAPPPADVGPTDVAILSYTSGTTGPPKGVRNPHRSYVDAGERLAAACDTDETDRGLLVLPLFHANPTTYGLMQMLAVGGSVAPVREFSASGFFETARESGSTFFTHVGSVLHILQETIADGDVDTESPLRFAVGGAAQFDRREAFEAATGTRLVRLYGLSEVGAGLVTTCRYPPESDGDDQGAVAGQPFDVRILDADAGEFVGEGERGEIVVRPERPGLMFRGYRGKPEATVETWQDCWVHTGDLGEVVDGRLRYLGRLGSHIRRMGENVSPWEVESALADWDRVSTAVAVGVPDETAGEEIGLRVVPADDAAPPTPAAVYERCRERLPERLRPRYVAVVDEVPRGSTHKVKRERIDREALREAWDARKEP
ncbi:MAG: class I adenylate-forming enzyme family protein [Haloferacaceae archaeon]